MIFNEMFISIFIFYAFFLQSYNLEEVQTIYVRGIRCNCSDKYVYPNISCFAKSYSRTFSTVNIIATTKYPLNYIDIEVRLFYKYGTIYREVMHTPRVEWCQLSKENSRNLMVKALVDVVKDSAPEFIHPCPYEGLNVRNRSIKTKSVPSIFPSGDYKLIFYLFDKEGEEIGAANLIGSVISPNKDTFG